MATIYKRGKIWYTRFRNKKIRHNIPLGRDYQQALIDAPRVQAEKRGSLEMADGKHGDVSWRGFKGRYRTWAVDGKGKDAKTNDTEKRAIAYLEKEFPIQRIQDITPSLLETFQTRLLARKLKNSNVNRNVRAIKVIVNKASEWELTPHVEWRKRPKALPEPRGKVAYFSPEECLAIYKKAGKYEIWARLTVRAGLRRSEVYFLKWDNVDLKNGYLAIRHCPEWHPKKHKERVIPIPEDLVDYLKKVPRLSPWVVGRDVAQVSNATKYFKRVIKRAKLRGSLHTMRHSYASHLAPHVPLNTIGDLLGHADPKTTKIYAHLSPQHLREAVLKLPKIGASRLPGTKPGTKI